MKVENGFLTSGKTSLNVEECSKMTFEEFSKLVKGKVDEDVKVLWDVIKPKKDERTNGPRTKSESTNGAGPDPGA